MYDILYFNILTFLDHIKVSNLPLKICKENLKYCWAMKEEHDVPSQYKALFREVFTMTMITLSGLLASCKTESK